MRSRRCFDEVRSKNGCWLKHKNFCPNNSNYSGVRVCRSRKPSPPTPLPKGEGHYYLAHCPIFSVPNVPIPFSRNAKTIRFSLRKPTLKVKSCAVIMQHFHV